MFALFYFLGKNLSVQVFVNVASGWKRNQIKHLSNIINASEFVIEHCGCWISIGAISPSFSSSSSSFSVVVMRSTIPCTPKCSYPGPSSLNQSFISVSLTSIFNAENCSIISPLGTAIGASVLSVWSFSRGINFCHDFRIVSYDIWYHALKM